MTRHQFNHYEKNTVPQIAVASNNTLQETNIPQLGKRKIIFKSALVGDMLVPGRVLLVQSTNLQSADVLDPRTMDLVWLDTPGALGFETVRGWANPQQMHDIRHGCGTMATSCSPTVSFLGQKWSQKLYSKLSRLQYPKIFQHIPFTCYDCKNLTRRGHSNVYINA